MSERSSKEGWKMRVLKFFGLAVALIFLALVAGNSGQVGLAQNCTVIVHPGQSIQKAIDQAPAGAVICLEAGIWDHGYGGPLARIKKNLTLRGAGPDQTILTNGRLEAISIEGFDIRVTIENLTIQKFDEGLEIQDSPQVTIRNCRISDNDSGLSIWDQAQVVVQNSQISGNHQGFLGGGSHLLVQDSIISNNGRGFYVVMGDDTSQTTVWNSQISKNVTGFYVSISKGQLTVLNSRVVENSYYGFLVRGHCKVTIQDSEISKNGSGGLYVMGDVTTTVQSSQVLNNRGCGLCVAYWGKAAVFNSRISGNSFIGVYVFGGGEAVVQDSTISHNGDAGISVWIFEGALGKARILRNTIFKNQDHGIKAYSPDAIVECQGNAVFDNVRGNCNWVAAQRCPGQCP